MTTDNPQPELDVELVRALRELVDVAIAARPYVEHSQAGRYVPGLTERAAAAGDLLDRLDGAIADAGEAIDGASS